MKQNKFVEMASKYFLEVLAPYGFESTKSQGCTLYRKVSSDFYHIILAEQGGGGSWFDVRVYAASPLIEPNFDQHFPDSLGIPTGNSSFLHPKFGVCHRHKTFPCKTEEGFVRNFNKDIKGPLVENAVEYLDGIQSLSDLVPLIKHDFYLGAALWHVGDKDRGKDILLSEQSRLSTVSDDSGRVASLLNYIASILN